MNNKKLEKLGSQLGVDASDIKIGKVGRILKKILFPVTQLMVILLSTSSGGIFKDIQSRGSWPYCPNYPYYTSPSPIYYLGGFSVVGIINTISGIFMMSNRNLKLNKYVKISLFLGVFAISAFLYDLIFNMITFPNVGSCDSIMYGVYSKKKPKVIEILLPNF